MGAWVVLPGQNGFFLLWGKKGEGNSLIVGGRHFYVGLEGGNILSSSKVSKALATPISKGSQLYVVGRNEYVVLLPTHVLDK